MNEKEFKELYLKNTNKKVAEILGISEPTVMNYAKKFKISKGKGNRTVGRSKIIFTK